MLAIVLAYLWYVKKENAKQAPIFWQSDDDIAQHEDQENTFVTVVKKSTTEANPSNEPPPYRCVVIKTGSQTCEAVRALGSKPILLAEAPLLPLTGCQVRKCQCKFTRHDDRRMVDRRTFFGAAKEIMENHRENRQRKDRRKSVN